MPRLTLFACASFVACACALRIAHADETQTVHTFARALTKQAAYKYLLALPSGYDAHGERRWPMILFLHGSGERGDDVWTITKHGPPRLLRGETANTKNETPAPEQSPAAAKLLAENFIVVSPQCPKDQWWDSEAVLALLDEIVATHRVDTTRVYLTGLSMGGFGTWQLGLSHPERFAAIVPVCGGGNFADAFHANRQKRAELRSLAVWAFHGAKDPTVPLAESERMVDQLKKLQVGEVQLTVYPDAKHDSWTETYANPELYRWLLRHQRAAGGAATQ
jgi:predicted peptidase